jgi:hypothetical protein
MSTIGGIINEATGTPENRAITLEHIVDRDGLLATLQNLASIANGKADHISENWQDESMARVWRKMAARIVSLSESESLRNLCAVAGEDVREY